MDIKFKNNDVYIFSAECLNIELCAFCGQAFRFKKNTDGSLSVVVKGKKCTVFQNENEIILKDVSKEDFENIWYDYFDLSADYVSYCNRFYSDKHLTKAKEQYYGIRILKQDPWEALCSFIISQNNNIPRITGIIERLCENFGDKIGDYYTFPSYERLKDVTVEDLSVLRAGFRSKYIVDAIKKLVNREIILEDIYTMPIEQARQELMKIKGVGAKVAECTLLYGFNRIEAFPVDVWVKRIMSEMYPEGLPECVKGIEGIAQQYLFHYRRNSEDFN